MLNGGYMRFFKETLITIIGCAFMAAGITLFLLPNQLSSGGFNGISTILYYLFGAKIGTTTLILNIPLFIIAYIKMGRNFFVRAIVRNSSVFPSFKCF